MLAPRNNVHFDCDIQTLTIHTSSCAPALLNRPSVGAFRASPSTHHNYLSDSNGRPRPCSPFYPGTDLRECINMKPPALIQPKQRLRRLHCHHLHLCCKGTTFAIVAPAADAMHISSNAQAGPRRRRAALAVKRPARRVYSASRCADCRRAC